MKAAQAWMSTGDIPGSFSGTHATLPRERVYLHAGPVLRSLILLRSSSGASALCIVPVCLYDCRIQSQNSEVGRPVRFRIFSSADKRIAAGQRLLAWKFSSSGSASRLRYSWPPLLSALSALVPAGPACKRCRAPACSMDSPPTRQRLGNPRCAAWAAGPPAAAAAAGAPLAARRGREAMVAHGSISSAEHFGSESALAAAAQQLL